MLPAELAGVAHQSRQLLNRAGLCRPRVVSLRLRFVVIESHSGIGYTLETWSIGRKSHDTRRTTVFDREKLPGSGSGIAPINAKFYAIALWP